MSGSQQARIKPSEPSATIRPVQVWPPSVLKDPNKPSPPLSNWLEARKRFCGFAGSMPISTSNSSAVFPAEASTTASTAVRPPWPPPEDELLELLLVLLEPEEPPP